ncbi:hypothetical protein HPB52_012290 [Rhipicephalus sanguineus]|uniref:Uncharacterized protein n=1 Tax=Rhipicephalus sanguineus TaxID=34632 RepID=A0A9D4T9R7_RHISA|nr:hypothetical protein HPB52_012290 [Rhipicephalus sanguineus]
MTLKQEWRSSGLPDAGMLSQESEQEDYDHSQPLGQTGDAIVVFFSIGSPDSWDNMPASGRPELRHSWFSAILQRRTKVPHTLPQLAKTNRCARRSTTGYGCSCIRTHLCRLCASTSSPRTPWRTPRSRRDWSFATFCSSVILAGNDGPAHKSGARQVD